MIREAICAGTWYPDKKKEIEKYINLSAKKIKAIACVCPHAGWIYSGTVAGEVYSSIKPAGLYILVGPNHRGIGPSLSVFPEGEWETPLGNLKVADQIVSSILKKTKNLHANTSAHLQEHSIEVQMPFIKYFNPDALIVPISIYDYSIQTCKQLGTAIADAVIESNFNGNTMLVASSDMSHYISAKDAEKEDSFAIEKMLKLDSDGLLKVVSEKNISMCGSGPAAIVIEAAKKLGASSAKLISYSNSGKVSGDNNEVVSYAGIVIS